MFVDFLPVTPKDPMKLCGIIFYPVFHSFRLMANSYGPGYTPLMARLNLGLLYTAI